MSQTPPTHTLPTNQYTIRRMSMGMAFLITFHRQVFGKDSHGRLPSALSEDAWCEPGYCLDASEQIPAGSCVDVTAPDDPMSFSDQTYVQRSE